MHNWLVCEIATKKGVGLTVRLLLGTTWGPGLLSEEETANQKGVDAELSQISNFIGTA